MNPHRLAQTILTALVLSCLAIPARAQEDTRLSARIATAMQPFVEKSMISGAVGLVGNGDGVLAVSAVGLRDVENDLPMKADTIFRVMSMTKPITSTAIMILVDEGKLAIDDSVEKHLPAFQGQKMADGQPVPQVITIRDLLTHTSGLPDGGPPPEPGPPSLARTVTAIAKRALTFPPGSKWSYSNAGMTTLGRIVEVASGKPYEIFLRERIFDPLGMPDTTFYPSAEQMKRVAILYSLKDGALIAAATSRVAPDPAKTIPGPAGGLFSTASDMARFYQMVLNRGMSGTKRILSEKAVSEMTRVQTGDIKCGFVDGMSFGLGWGVVRVPSGVTSSLSAGSFGHGGAYGTQGWIDPDRKTFSVLMIQRSDLGNSDASPMRAALLGVAAERTSGQE